METHEYHWCKVRAKGFQDICCPFLSLVVNIHSLIILLFNFLWWNHKYFHIIEDNPWEIGNQWYNKYLLEEFKIAILEVQMIKIQKVRFLSQNLKLWWLLMRYRVPFQVPSWNHRDQMNRYRGQIIKSMENHRVLKSCYSQSKGSICKHKENLKQ